MRSSATTYRISQYVWLLNFCTSPLTLSPPQYNWTLSTDASPEVSAIFDLAKSRLPVAIETKLATFPSAIFDTHGKDLTISADASRTGTPAPASTPPSGTGSSLNAQPVASAPPKPKSRPVKVNSTTVVVEADFHASAEDLFSLLTDEKRIPAWTRAPAQVWSHLSFHI